MANPMKPNQSVLIKLGRALVHYQRYVETDRHTELKNAEALINDAEISEWLGEMTSKGHLPALRG